MARLAAFSNPMRPDKARLSTPSPIINAFLDKHEHRAIAQLHNLHLSMKKPLTRNQKQTAKLTAIAFRLSTLAAVAVALRISLSLTAALPLQAAPVADPAVASKPVLAAPVLQIPSLRWQERSDWINVKTKFGATGDGKADDTTAIQKALDKIQDGSTLYLSSGTYRITATLSLRNPNGGRWQGGAIIGCGRDTKLVWDGEAGGTMLLINGVALSRFVGFELDGRRKAAVGFRYKSTQGFQTEVTHRDLAFRGFTDAGVLDQHTNEEVALAETTFENCLFEDNERGVTFLWFNDYDFTFDGCEFRNNGVAIICSRGNFYVRNCHFEGSRDMDIYDNSEHSSSIRRSTSSGSKTFVFKESTVAPLTIQDCHVDGWKNPEGAVILSSRPPVTIFDCVFTTPPKDAQDAGIPPIRAHSDGQRLVFSDNRVEGAHGLLHIATRPAPYNVPAGVRKGVIRSAKQSFLQDTARIPQRVFDAKVDFAAKGDGTAADTDAIQKTIAAARAHGKDAIAYLPTGSYVVTRPLSITGRDYFVGGSGWSTWLIWKGAEGGTMVEVRDPQQVTLENISIGTHDAGVMNNDIDIHQTGSAKPSRMTYDGVYAFGIYQKQPLRKGLRFTGLTDKDVVVMQHVQGNLRFINSARATVLANVSYEGSVVVEGKDKVRGGLLGFQTRLATIVTHGLYLRDNHSIVMSDFYTEQAENGYLLEGAPDDPPGRATIAGAKLDYAASDDPAKAIPLDIRNYHGQIFFGPYQFYQSPKIMRLKQQGTSPVELFLIGSTWYGASPDFQLGPATKLFVVGNESFGIEADIASVSDQAPDQGTVTGPDLVPLSRALDDLRRLGEADQRLNHPPTDTP